MSRAPQPSTVSGSQRFDVCLAHVLESEGGFVNHPSDPGGATNLGISLRFAIAEHRASPESRALFDLDMDGDVDGADIRQITRSEASAIYRRCFWDRYRCGDLPRTIDHCVFDQAVNAGGRAAVMLLQRSINLQPPFERNGPQLVVDGVIGRRTIAAIMQENGVCSEFLVKTFRLTAERRYRDIVARNPALEPFLRGWLARARRLGTV